MRNIPLDKETKAKNMIVSSKLTPRESCDFLINLILILNHTLVETKLS